MRRIRNRLARLAWLTRNFERQGVIVFFLEVFGDGAEIEDEEILFVVTGVADLEGEQARAASLDLYVFRGRENRTHQTDVEHVAAIVAGGEHVHRNGDAFGAPCGANLAAGFRRVHLDTVPNFAARWDSSLDCGGRFRGP